MTPIQGKNPTSWGTSMRFFSRKKQNQPVGPIETAEPMPPFAEPHANARSHERFDASASDLTVGDYAQGVPQIRIGEMLRVFGQQLRWAVPAFIAGVALSWYLTKDFQRSYSGEGRVLAQLSSEYVYEPVAGQTSPGLMLTPDHIVLNEVGIMTSPTVIKSVLEELAQTYGLGRVDEANASKIRAGEKLSDNPDLYVSFEKRFSAAPRAKSSIIDLAFKHEDPEIAVAGLNAFLEAYMRERKEIFVSEAVDVVSKRREATEEQLAQNEREIAGFLRRNNISDFDSEREGATERTEELKTTLNTLRGDVAEMETALAKVESQLRGTPPEIDLFVDDRASQRVAQAELELKQLLAKYLPGSDPVRQKQTEIAELRSLQTANGGRAAGGRRVGPNPVYQNLLERRNELASQANAMREKEVVVQRQLNSVDAKSRRMRDLSPRVENLLRERETLQAILRTLNTREQEALVNQQQAQASSENVHVISRAETARKGRNMRAVMWLLGSVAIGGLIFLLALLRTFLDPRLYARTSSVPSHGGTDRAGGRRTDDNFIPEPVQPFVPNTPAPPPFPDMMPAAQAELPLEPQVEITPMVQAAGVASAAVATTAMATTAAAPSYESAAAPSYDGNGPELFSESFAHNYRAPEMASAQAPAAEITLPTDEPSSSNPYMTANVAQLFDPTEEP
jgi:uncharacterized protein involved in exopolysaccharide biosynthesis